MPIAIHDSGRTGKLGWAEQAVTACGVRRVILNPFETPPDRLPRRPAASECVSQLTALGAEVLLDPTTHALHSTSNQFDVYDRWDLWPRNIRQVSTQANAQDHVQRCLAHQRALGVPALVPTPALSTPTSNMSRLAIEMMQTGLGLDGSAIVSIAGQPNFWASEAALDAFVGEVAQLRPREVILTVVHTESAYPVRLDPRATHGVCRTTHALSLRSEVTLAHGDFAGLPAVAAGATYLGTGWDLGQRRLTPDNTVRVDSPRRTASRYTHRGLLAVLKGPEGERLRDGNPQLSAQLVPGNLPVDMTSSWRAHLTTIRTLANLVAAPDDVADRVKALRDLYDYATAAFPHVYAVARPLAASEPHWIDQHRKVDHTVGHDQL